MIRLIDQVLARVARGTIRLYQTLRTGYPPRCRFVPSCSAYAHEAFRQRGFWYGSYLSTCRILKCHPWHAGGYDPLPTSCQLSAIRKGLN